MTREGRHRPDRSRFEGLHVMVEGRNGTGERRRDALEAIRFGASGHRQAV